MNLLDLDILSPEELESKSPLKRPVDDLEDIADELTSNQVQRHTIKASAGNKMAQLDFNRLVDSAGLKGIESMAVEGDSFNQSPIQSARVPSTRNNFHQSAQKPLQRGSMKNIAPKAIGGANRTDAHSSAAKKPRVSEMSNLNATEPRRSVKMTRSTIGSAAHNRNQLMMSNNSSKTTGMM